MTRGPTIGVAVAIVLVAGLVLALSRSGDTGAAAASRSPGAEPSASGTPRPIPKHEVYGYVPYWEMDETIADHLATTNLTTLALFSVTNTRDGSIDTTQNGYKRITSPVGERMIREAHERGVRVELVFTSFGEVRNQRLFGADAQALRNATLSSLTEFAADHGFDGINVDVESLGGPEFIPAYAGFVEQLRQGITTAIPKGQVSVATTAGRQGAAMAAAAALAGADRIFLMGYDYRVGGSDPGATSPLDRRDGSEQDLVWSLDLYEAFGVPVERTILGLPLYGLTWPVAGPALGETRTGDGDTWVPNDNLGFLASPPIPPERDEIEIVEFYAIPPADGATPDPSDGSPADGWRAVYMDSPATLTPKLALADQRGLAGAGFWALGYERGVPAYTDLINSFGAGDLDR